MVRHPEKNVDTIDLMAKTLNVVQKMESNEPEINK
jgi:hypothetical protein